MILFTITIISPIKIKATPTPSSLLQSALIRLVGIMLENIMINPRSIKTIPMWKVVTQESDLSGGLTTTSSSSSSMVPTLPTLCLLVQMMD